MAKVFSNEDGSQSSSIRVLRKVPYSDVDLTFSARTTEDGDVFKKTDASAVKQAIKTLLLTNYAEKPYAPTYGANLGSMLFELMDEDTGADIVDDIQRTISSFESRAEVISIDVRATPDYNSVYVLVEFRVVNTDIVDTLRVNLTGRNTGPSYDVVLPTTPDPVFDNILLTGTRDSDGFGGDRIETISGILLQLDGYPLP